MCIRDSSGLLCDGLVGEDLDPDLTATRGVTGHGDTGGLDLIAGDPAGLQGDQEMCIRDSYLLVGDLDGDDGVEPDTCFLQSLSLGDGAGQMCIRDRGRSIPAIRAIISAPPLST